MLIVPPHTLLCVANSFMHLYVQCSYCRHSPLSSLSLSLSLSLSPPRPPPPKPPSLASAQASVDEPSEDKDKAGGEKAAEAEPAPPSTKKPEVIPFPDDLTAMQVDCGTFHTAVLLHSGELYTFGNGNHGQLGQGNNKVW